MNLGSKGKKRVVLPSRPDPPTVDQIVEDLSEAQSNDPIFSILEKIGQDSPRSSPDSDTELKFQQCQRYVELNQQLQEAQKRLLLQRAELQAAGEQLEQDVVEVKSRALTPQHL